MDTWWLARPMEIEQVEPWRLPSWDPGVRGGVPETPVRLELTPSYIRDHGTFAAALRAAIASVPTPGAVLIPARAEPYELDRPVALRSGVVVCGEGPHKTVLRARVPRTGSGIDGSGFHPVFRCQGELVATLEVTAAVAAGDQKVLLGPHIFGARPEVGQLLVLSMENDPAHGWDRFEWERRVRGQPLMATVVSGLEVTLDAPVRLDYPLDFRPEVALVRPIQGAGLEDLKVVMDAEGESDWACAFWYAVNCWLRNCEITPAPDVAVWVWNSRWVTLEGCHVHGALSLDGGRGYGVNVCGHSGDCLVTDGIFEGLRHSLLTQFGASGNVFSYNLSRAPAMSDLALHGWYPYMNLFESNVAAQGYADAAWGRAGEHNTYFRNRLTSYYARYEAEHGVDYSGYADHLVEGIQIDVDSDRQNILGNTLVDAQVVLRGCADTWAEKNLVAGAAPDAPLIDADDATTGTVDVDNHAPPGTAPSAQPATAARPSFRPSLYLAQPPDFWPASTKPWPATGSDVDHAGPEGQVTLPAEDRYAHLPWRPGWGPRVPRVYKSGAADGWVGYGLGVYARLYHMDAAIQLRCVVDWGDGQVEAGDLVRSGTRVERAHAFDQPGVYGVRWQARDQYGLTSRWSTPVWLTITEPD